MRIKHRKPSASLSSEITPKTVYLDRQSLMRTVAVTGAGMAALLGYWVFVRLRRRLAATARRSVRRAAPWY